MSSTGANGRCNDLASCATTSASRSSGACARIPGRDEHARVARDSDATVLDRHPDAATGRAERRLAPRHRLALELRPLLRRQRRIELVDPVQQPTELEATEHLLQLRPVRCSRDERVRVDVERKIAAHRRELLRGPGLVGVLANSLPSRGRQLVGVGDYLLQRAVLGDQLTGRLVADPGNAGDVVRRVALEADEIRHLIGAHAVAELDALRRVDVDVRDAARRHHQRHVLRAELERIAVGGDDAGLDTGFVGAGRDRRDHIVGFPAFELEVAVPERFDDGPEMRELLTQQVGHRLAPFLVDHVRCFRDGCPMDRARVPRDGDAARLVVGEQLEEHVPEPEQRVRGHPVTRRELLGQGEERAVGEVVAVHEEQLGAARGAVVELELGARDRLRSHAAESMQDRPRGRCPARYRPAR